MSGCRRDADSADPIRNLYALWVRDALELAYDQVRCHAGQAVRRQKRRYNQRAVKRLFTKGDWTMRYYPPAKKFMLDSQWLGPYLVMSIAIGQLVSNYSRIHRCFWFFFQDLKKIPRPRSLVSWLPASDQPVI